MPFPCLIEIDCLHGNVYVAQLTKYVELPFAPYPGLSIAPLRRPSTGIHDDNDYAALLACSTNPSAIVLVDRVLFYLDDKKIECSFRLTARQVVDENLGRLRCFVDLMEKFYGFNVEAF